MENYLRSRFVSFAIFLDRKIITFQNYNARDGCLGVQRHNSQGNELILTERNRLSQVDEETNSENGPI